ncbi:uncharacterized protein LOC122500879 isoform X2 [Leptopilina heterotoma]|uniref:uncharacterized protein LOC122500879 isoform X2 n=1 Tax=Leptopilina heterotoma TaxID=63436 RepID=UPI001CA9D03F|nr:uncharacterized protein LOC122500879 isoform X2 [Leptopilina heterotoma]
MNIIIYMGILFLLLLTNIDVKNSQLLKIGRIFCDNSKYHENNEFIVSDTTQQIKSKENVNHFLHLNVEEIFFGLFTNLPKMKDLQLTILSVTTDALISALFVTKFLSLGMDFASEFSRTSFSQQTASGLMKRKSLQFTIFKGIIVTEIVTKLLKLITNPAVAENVTSIQIRKKNFQSLFWIRYRNIDKFLIHKCSESTAMNIIKHYCFSSPRFGVMYYFIKYISDNGYPSEAYDKYWLKDPKLYEKLRFNLYLEVGLSKRAAIERMHNIYNQEEMNLIKDNPEKLFADYLTNKLFDKITFDDYYAIKNFLVNDFPTINVEHHIFWRMKKALYSLVIRQWDLKPVKSTKKMICTLRSNSFANSKRSLWFLEFTICNEYFNGTENYNTINVPFIEGNHHSVAELTIPLRFRSFIHSELLADVANKVSLYAENISGDHVSESFRRLKCW